MPAPIAPLRSLPPVEIAAPSPPRDGGTGFGDLLTQSIARVEQVRGEAADAVGRLLSGEGGELHTAALAAQRAELSFELFLQVRNKAVQAYQEIMRMQM